MDEIYEQLFLELQDEMSSKLEELESCQKKLSEAEEMRARDLQEQEEIAAEFEQMQQQVSLRISPKLKKSHKCTLFAYYYR